MLILEAILFFVSIVICFYLPGRLYLLHTKLTTSAVTSLIFSMTLGIIFFTFTAFILESFKIFILIYPLLILIVVWALKKRKFLFISLSKNDWIILAILFCAAFIFCFSMIASGQFGETILLHGSNGGDSLWRLSLMNEMQYRFPPDNPGFSGVRLQGYHFFYDFLLAKLLQIFHFSPTDLYFRFFTLLTGFLWGGNVFLLMKSWSRNTKIALWAIFLTLFAGSFSFVLPILGFKGLSYDSAFGMLQPSLALINPEFSISIVLLTSGLFALHEYLQTKKLGWIIAFIFFFGLLTQFKVYAGIIALGGFAVFAGIQLIQKKAIFFLSLIGIGILFFFTYWRFTGKSGYLIWYPLWPPHEVFKANFPSFMYSDKMLKYSQYYDIVRIILLESEVFFIFLLGNIGTRIVGLIAAFFYPEKRKQLFDQFSFLIFIILLLSFFIPLFFIQSIKVFETTQFFNYFLFFSSLYAAFGMFTIFHIRWTKGIKIFIFIIFILLTIPTAFINYRDYLFNPPKVISSSKLHTLQFLKKQGNYDATVLEFPAQHVTANFDFVRDWYSNESDLGIMAFSNKRGFMTNEDYGFPNQMLEPRLRFLQQLITFEQSPTEADSGYIRRTFREKNIVFIFSTYRLNSFERYSLVKLIYQNGSNYVYKISEG